MDHLTDEKLLEIVTYELTHTLYEAIEAYLQEFGHILEDCQEGCSSRHEVLRLERIHAMMLSTPWE